MAAPDNGAPTAPSVARPWPIVRRSTDRYIRVFRAMAVLALAYGVVMLVVATRDVRPSPWLWVAIVVGGLVHLTGVVGMWFLPPRSPERVSPLPGPEAGTGRDRRRAQRAMRRGEPLDEEARRLVAVEVSAGARLALWSAWMFAWLGPVALGTTSKREPLPWLGPATAAASLLVVVLAVWQVVSARRLHQAALRADALPRFEARDAPYLP